MHRPIMNWEDHVVTLVKRQNLGTRPHPRALLSEYELSIRKADVRPRKQERDPKSATSAGLPALDTMMLSG